MKKLIYIYDAYCPWCYAFTPVVQQLYEHYRDSFEFEVLSGGMIVDDQIKTMGRVEKSESLRKSYQRIEEQTGAVFGEAFFGRIGNEETVMNSEIPARALAVFRGLPTSHSPIEFVHQMLNSLFLEGSNPNNIEFYKELATRFNLNPEIFAQNMEMEHFHQQARYDFFLAKQLQATAFPRLYLQTSDTYFHMISKGYSDYNKIVQIIDKITTDKPVA
jgi:putative protein-disulfide isomerase